MRVPKKDGVDQAIGRSPVGLRTKIYTLVDALANSIGFFLSGGQTHELIGADDLLPTMQATTLLPGKAYDADERVLAVLHSEEKTLSSLRKRTERSTAITTKTHTKLDT